MFSLPTLPTSVTKLATALNSNLNQFATESLAKTKDSEERSALDLRMWAEKQQDKQDVRINAHLTRTRLTTAEQTAVQAWKDAT